MKKNRQKTKFSVIFMLINTITFFITEYLSYRIINSHVFFQFTDDILRISGNLALALGILWLMFLYANKKTHFDTWKELIPFVASVILIEYSYFVWKIL